MEVDVEDILPRIKTEHQSPTQEGDTNTDELAEHGIPKEEDDVASHEIAEEPTLLNSDSKGVTQGSASIDVGKIKEELPDPDESGTRETEKVAIPIFENEACIKTEKNEDEGTPNANPREDLDAVDGGSLVAEQEKFIIEPKELECLFFGSFYNEKQLKEAALDLVTFATPCKITEIRVIPLGATVELLDGVALLGSTNPTNFEVELYYEDLMDPTNATFKEISKFTYDHKLAINSSCGSEESPIITSKVVVRGIYNSITLAVIGHQVENFPVKAQLPDTESVDSYFDQASLTDDNEGQLVDEDWDEDDEDYGRTLDEDGDYEYSEYSDDQEEFKSGEELMEGDGRYSEDADDDVEMKDAFDSNLDDEEDFQDETQSLSPSSTDELTPSPSRSWEETKERASETFDQRTPSPEDYIQSDQWGMERTQDAFDEEEEEKANEFSAVERRSQSTEKSSGSLNSPDKYHTESDTEESSLVLSQRFSPRHESVNQLESFSPGSEECESDSFVPIKTETVDIMQVAIPQSELRQTPSPPKDVNSGQFGGFQSKLETEDISDGDISSMEEEMQFPIHSDEEMDLDKDCSSPLLEISQSPPVPAAENEDDFELPNRNETSTSNPKADDDVSSLRDFEDDFEDDLEVVSDDEIGDEYASSDAEETSASQTNDEAPDYYNRPFDLEAFQLCRLKNLRLEMYPNITAVHDATQNERLRVALNTYVPPIAETEVEEWVGMMEDVLPTLSAYLRGIPQDHVEGTFDTLLFWVKRSFQLESTTSSESVTRTLRQLKVALKLVFVLCEFNPNLSVRVSQLMLDSQNTVQERVTHTLLDSRIPAVQCLCIKVIEATLNTQTGFECFVAKEGCQPSIFEQLLSRIMDLKLNTLVYANIGSIFHAVSLIPLLIELGEQNDGEVEMEAVLTNMKEIVDVVQEIERKTFCSKRSPLATSLNTVSLYMPGHDPRTSFVKLLRETCFLDSSYKLIRRVGPNHSYQFVSLLVTILQSLLKWEAGILFLADEMSLEFLLAINESGHSHGMDFVTYFCHCATVLKCIDLCHDMAQQFSTDNADDLIDGLMETFLLLSSNLGRLSVTRMYTTGNFIEGLLNCIKYSFTTEDKTQELEKTAIGGYAVEILVHVIRTADNLPFLSEHGHRISRLYDSIGEDFEGHTKLTEVIGFIRPTLDSTCCTFEGVADVCEKLKVATDESLFKSTVLNWGIPPEIVTRLRILDSLATHSNTFQNTLSEVTGDINAGRVREGAAMSYRLASKCALVQINSEDILTTLAEILRKVTTEYKHPAVNAHTFLFSKGEAIAALLLPTVRLIRTLLTEIISIRNTGFRDLTLVPLLLQTFLLADSYPQSATAVQMIAKIKVHIVASLQTYTIPVIKMGDDAEDELVNSAWTRMMSELISFTMTSPSNFISGLKIFSELQPLKLPLVADKELSDAEKVRLTSSRKLWSAFLHGVTAPLQEMIGVLCESTNRELQVLLKKVCEQIADLSGPSCLVVCRSIMEPILNSIEADLDEKVTASPVISSQGTATVSRGNNSAVTAWVEGSVDRRSVQCSIRTVRLLRFFNGLLRNSGVIKAGVIQVLRCTFKVDEKFSDFLTLLASVLTTCPSDKGLKLNSLQTKGQDLVMSIFHTMCNLKVNIFGNAKGIVDEDYLKSNSLPPKEAMSIICTSLISFLCSQETVLGNVGVIRKIFSSINLLIDTEYGFYHLRIALSKNPTVISDLVQKLSRKDVENLDIVGVMESLEVVDGLLSLLRKLIMPQKLSPTKHAYGCIGERKTILSKTEVRKLLGWTSPEAMQNHPLVQLCMRFRVCITRDHDYGTGGRGSEEQQHLKTYLREAREKLDKILFYVNAVGNDSQGIMNEVTLSPAESLQEQFGRRSVRTPCQFEDAGKKLQYLASIGQCEESEHELSMEDLVFRDLMATVQDVSNESETEFMKELKKFCNANKESCTEEKSEERNDDSQGGKTTLTSNNTASQHSTVSSLSSPIVKSVFARGSGVTGRLGFGRGLLSTRPNFDPFRSRPPNTSRPPSLHVDDFVAMESSSQGSNASSRGRTGSQADGFRLLGRGARGAPSPLSRSFNAPERTGRGYRPPGGTSNTSYYPARNEQHNPSRGRQQHTSPGYSDGGGSGDRWQMQSGGNDGSQRSNYGRGERDSNYGDRRHYGSGGNRGYRDQRGGGGGRSPGNSSGPNSSQQQQRWRNASKGNR